MVTTTAAEELAPTGASRGISRRQLIQSPVRRAAAAPGRDAASRGAASIRLPATAPAPDPALHLLRRTSFGVRSDELQEARQAGPESYLERQLHPASIPDGQTERLVEQRYPGVFLPVRELFEERNPLTLQQFIDATVLRPILSTRQLYEVMVDFWSNHFSIYLLKGDDAWLKLIDDREVIRANALGSFRDLLYGSAKSPAMLFYLDNYTNKKDGPNENYARELLELHTLGVDNGYTQEDVEELARVLTGWSLGSNVSPRPGEFAFLPGNHDEGDKVVLGQQILSDGIREGEVVLDMLAAHPNTAQYLATKLCRRFVADEPPKSIVDAAAQTFLSTGGDIKSVLRTILLSDELFAAPDMKIQRPFEFLVAVMRALDVFPTHAGIAQVEETLALLGQLPHHRLDPDGYPDVAEAWVSSDGLLTRWNFVYRLVEQPGQAFPWRLDRLVDGLDQPSPAMLTDRLVDRLLHRTIDSGDREVMVSYAAQGHPVDAPLAAGEIETVGRRLVVYILNSPYFQLR